jgi:ankyrin repeat protein
MSNSLKTLQTLFSEGKLDVNDELKNILKSEKKTYDTIKFLIEKGADVNKKKDRQISILGYALKYNASYKIIKLLIEKGADINKIHKEGSTILMFAVQFNTSYNIIKLLIEKGADVNALHNSSGTILMMALLSNTSYNIIKLLIEKGADINKIHKEGSTILMFAVQFNTSYNIIQLLIEKGADINTYVNKYGQTLLMFAVQSNTSDNIIELFIENGANVNSIDTKNRTILMNALKYYKNYNVIKLLIEKGADVNIIDENGQTLLMFIVQQYNHSDNIIELLIEKRPDLNIIDQNGETILMHSLKHNVSYNIIKLLIENGANVNMIDENNLTILMNALKFKASYNIIKLLIENNADINAIDIDVSILMLSLITPSSNNIIQLLIKSGANVNHTYSDGRTILFIAFQYKASEKSIKLLIKKGADLNPININPTILLLALQLGFSEKIIKLLIKKGAHINAKTIKDAIKNRISDNIIRLLTNKTDKSSTLKSRSKYDSKYVGVNTLCNNLFEKFSDINLKNKLIFLCNKTNLTEEITLNASKNKDIFTELKDRDMYNIRTIYVKEKIELQKIDITNSNNINNYYIKYPGIGIDEGGLRKQFFTNAMEQMFSKYFILIEGTEKFRLKDSITTEEASKAGFLVAFSLINDMPFTKHINNIYIAMMMYKVSQLTVEDYFLYAILDMDEDGIKIFQNTCSNPELLEDYCNPTTYYDEYIIANYGLNNKNLSAFIKSFNIHISKKKLRDNQINIYDISKKLTNTKITKKDLTMVFDRIRRNKINPDDKWGNIYNNLYAIMVDLDSSQYKEWLEKYGTVKQKLELSSIHKFHQKVFFFWTSLNTINTNMIPYYSIHYTSTGKHPKAHTCFNQLDIPVYENPEEMFSYLIQAIFSTDFGIA